MIFCVPVKGVFATNCYFAIDRGTNHGFLIDPGAEGEKLVQLILERGWIIEKILLTHGHFDHFGGVDAVRDALDIPVLIHEEGKAYLERSELNLSRFCGGDLTVEGAKYFRDGDLLELQEGDLRLKVRSTRRDTRTIPVYCMMRRRKPPMWATRSSRAAWAIPTTQPATNGYCSRTSASGC